MSLDFFTNPTEKAGVGANNYFVLNWIDFFTSFQSAENIMSGVYAIYRRDMISNGGF